MARGPVITPAPDPTTADHEAAPENPFGQAAGGQLKITKGIDLGRLHAELSAALPGVSIRVAASRKNMDAPTGPDNPGWLSWAPAALSTATAAKILAAHDPTSKDADPPMRIDGSQLAGRLDDLRQRLSAGEVLDPIELSRAVSLLLGVNTPAPTR